MADYRVLDIETVVDPEVWTPPEPRWKLAPRHSHLLGHLDLRQAIFEANVVLEEPFPPPHACRVVAMAWVDLTSHDDGRYYHFDDVVSACNWSADSRQSDRVEKSLLSKFISAEDEDAAQIVTWNGRSFDLPVVNLRALKHKLPMKWYYQERDVRYRFTDAGHCDLMDWLGDYGAGRNMKLHDVCRLIGLPGKTGDVSGGSVAEVVASGSAPELMEKVRHYCARDALQTAIAFVRTRFHKGMITAEQHDAAVGSFASDSTVRGYLDDVNWKGLKVS